MESTAENLEPVRHEMAIMGKSGDVKKIANITRLRATGA